MGWTFCSSDTRKDVIADNIKTWTSGAHTTECVAHCTRGNVLWAVYEVGSTETTETSRWIGCVLMQNGGREGWGCKQMEESMGPYRYICPLAYLDMVPEKNAEWRRGVREYHAAQRGTKALKIGDTLTFPQELDFGSLGKHATLRVVDAKRRHFNTKEGCLVSLRSATLRAGGYTVTPAAA